MRSPCRALLCRTAPAALVAAALAACTLFPPAPEAPTRELISQLPPDIPTRAQRAATLLVQAPATAPVYDTAQMAYTVQPYQIAYFARHEWGATPAEMLQPLLVRTLERTGAFSAVLTPSYVGRYSYVLNTEIVELAQDFTAAPAALHLSLRFRLSDGATARVIASGEINLREPMREKTPYAGVVAANAAAAKALREVARFVLANTP